MGSHQQLTLNQLEQKRIVIPPMETKERSQLPFVSLSTVIHILMVVSAVMVESPLLELKEKTETISIEFQNDLPAKEPMGQDQSAQAAALPHTNNITPAMTSEPSIAEPVTVAKAPQVAKTPSVPKAPQAKSQPTHVATKTYLSEQVDIPASVDEVALAADLDESALAMDTVPVKLDAESVVDDENDYKKIDQAHAQEAASTEKELKDLNNQMDQEQDSLAHQIADANSREEQQLQAAVAAKKAQYGAALAAAEAEAKARDEANAAAAAARAKAAAQAQQAKGIPTGGAGGGSATIRGLDQLKQMPGNPTPKYSTQERYLGQSGKVVFLAYVDKSGVPSDFRQTASTGYPNLDAKTLEALKKWKFYPGQEGWVEIPFRWDLQGGPQEARAIKR